MPPRKKANFEKKNNNKKNYKLNKFKAKPMAGPFHRYVSNDPFRATFNTKLTYTQSVTLTSGIGGIYGNEQIYRLNSPYDPDFTGTGHQPYGYDQVSLLYRKYKVNAAKISILFSNPSEDGMIGAAAVQASAGTFALTSNPIDTLKEQPMTVTRTINNSGSQTAMVNQYLQLHLVEGLTKLQFSTNVEDYSAPVTTIPAKTPYLRLALASSLGTNGATMFCRVTITYYCQFYERKTQAQS